VSYQASRLQITTGDAVEQAAAGNDAFTTLGERGSNIALGSLQMRDSELSTDMHVGKLV
jgi:hypothetical protein